MKTVSATWLKRNSGRSVSCKFSIICNTFYTEDHDHEKYIKTYKRRLPFGTFKQFVSHSKGKLVNDQCFESFMETCTLKYFKIKEQHKKLD